MLTRNGVAYNLEVSPYTEIITYSDNKSIKFVFSSEGNKTRFKDKLQDNRDRITTSLTKRFNFEISDYKLSDIQLYSNVEKRGFLIEEGNNQYKCLNTIKLNGQSKIQKK